MNDHFRSIPRSGYFFVGGRYETSGDRVGMVGQMYVEPHAPATITQPYPVVMIHGTAQTGANFTGTPDGRPGWAQRFVENGYVVYVVDQVGRGRSGENPSRYGAYARSSAATTEQQFTGTANFGLWPQAKLHTRWRDGPGVRGNAAFDQFFASQVPFIANAAKTEELMAPALDALLEKIGPAILLTHSQAGVFGFAACDRRPDDVKAHIAVEPNGPPFFDVAFKGGEDWWEQTGAARARPYGITRLPLTFDPPIASADELAIVQNDQVAPDCIRGWLQAKPARSLPNIAKVPTAVVTGEASFRAAVDPATVAFLRQAGVPAEHLALGAHGLHGNGHMMMLETNSDEIADLMIGWIEKRLR